MIKITTALPKQEVTSEFRLSMARRLARFLPSGLNSSDTNSPYPVADGDGVYVIDGHNDWFCRVYDDDSRNVVITYRDEAKNPGREFAFANWVIACRTGWTVDANAYHAVRSTAVVDVSLDVAFPHKVDEWELGTISFEIPVEHIGVFLDMKRVPGARVTGYTTTDNIEITDGEEDDV